MRGGIRSFRTSSRVVPAVNRPGVAGAMVAGAMVAGAGVAGAAMATGANNHREDDKCAYYAPLGSKFMNITIEIGKFIFEKSKLRWYICSSTAPTLAYIGFSFFLLYEYKDTEFLAVFILQSILAVLLGVINGVMTNSISRSDMKYVGVSMCFFILILFMLSILIGETSGYLYSDNIAYFITTLVLFVLSVNVIGLSIIIACILFALWLILLICESLIYPFKLFCCWLCTKKESEPRAAHSIFHYDKNKTEATKCPICLQEYKDGELIRRGKCHVSHIAHEECMLSWLKVKKSCPICGNPIELC